MSTAERFSTLLRRMLDRVGLVPFRSEVAEDGRVWFVVPNPNESPIEKLDVSMAADGDVEVALHVPGRRGSPFEQLFVWSSDPEYLPCVVEFVADLVEDRCVLAYRSGWFRGGREFVRRERLGDGEDAGFEWIATWSGVPPESVPPTEDRGPRPRLASWERELADRIERELVDASARYHRSHHEGEDVIEPYVSFAVQTPSHHGLDVELTIGSDQLTIRCSEAEARLQSAAFERDEDWEAACRRAVRYMLRHDLELRIHAGVLGPTGAIRLGPGLHDWAGELSAVRSGRRRVYAAWFERTAESEGPLRAYIDAGDIGRLLERVREITGIADIEWLEDLPPVAHYDDRELHPDRGIRVGPRFFTEMKEYPGDWWMGELDAEGELYVWGVYGDSLEEAVRSH